jgi:hypothetical protein
MNEDQGRRDDIWSLFYVLVEFLDGALPWTEARHSCFALGSACLRREVSRVLSCLCGRQEARSDKEQVLPMKQQLLNNPAQLTKNVPLPAEVRAGLCPAVRCDDAVF